MILCSFLNKSESISLGYLNKQIYTETQKQSYLLKRFNDNPFKFDESKATYIQWSESNGLAYQFPTQLQLCDVNQKASLIFNSNWFKKIFTRLNRVHFERCNYLSHIPIDILFNYNINYHRNLN